MATKVNVTDNLLIRTILSPVMKLTDATNRQTLINRVKKLDQSERKELKNELKHLSECIKAPRGLQPTDLRERGVAVLLLSDDGMPLQKKGTLIRIFQYIGNLIDWRISSDAIIKELIAVKEQIDEDLPPLPESDGEKETSSNESSGEDDAFVSTEPRNESEIGHRTVIKTLKQSKRDLNQKLDAPNGNEKMGEMNDILSSLQLESLPVKSGKVNWDYQHRYNLVITSVGLIPGMVDENPLAYIDPANFKLRMGYVKKALEVLRDSTNDKTIAQFILNSFESLSHSPKCALELICERDAPITSQNGGDFARVFLKNYVCSEVQFAHHQFDEKIRNKTMNRRKFKAIF